ncbi:hypothetical protein MHBO_003330 [Bonamia ostreae]|uniref:Uncharacterized protein n=1 Tax=Bonamia ostreae TaxID=126728 RepID=A0ABV2AQ54_9EUKA
MQQFMKSTPISSRNCFWFCFPPTLFYFIQEISVFDDIFYSSQRFLNFVKSFRFVIVICNIGISAIPAISLKTVSLFDQNEPKFILQKFFRPRITDFSLKMFWS